MSSHSLLKFLRKVHLYFGLFISPALIFFAFTGSLQSVNLHETTQGSNYKPPAWLASLAQLHKKQTTVVPVRRPRPDGAGLGVQAGPKEGSREGAGAERGSGKGPLAAASPVGPGAGPSAPPKGHWPMKIFFVLVSLGLFVSTLTGVYMAYQYTRRKWVVTLWLLAGVVLPVLLLPF